MKKGFVDTIEVLTVIVLIVLVIITSSNIFEKKNNTKKEIINKYKITKQLTYTEKLKLIK